MDKLFALKIRVEKYLEDKKLFVTFMDLEKAYEKIDRKGLWDALRIYRVGGHLLEGVSSYHEDASASVMANGELSGNFSVAVCVRQGYHNGCLVHIYMDGWDA